MHVTNSVARAILWFCVAVAVIAPSARALPPDPNNAALLYYQAFIMLPTDESKMRDLIDNLQYGVDPDSRARRYMQQCEPAITLAEDAARVPGCDWGLQYSHGIQMLLPHLSKMRVLARLMKAKTCVLLADGQYREALEEGLTMRRMARHIGDQVLAPLLVNIALDAMADKNIQSTLDAMPPDANTLSWLQNELASSSAKRFLFRNSLQGEKELSLVNFAFDRDQFLKALQDSEEDLPAGLVDRIESNDVSFLDRNRTYLESHVKIVQTIVDSNTVCRQKIKQLQDVASQLTRDTRENPYAVMAATVMPGFTKAFTYDARAKSNENMLKTAIEVCLVKAKTGSLPNQLPAGAPKDLLTNEDFKYERTKEGFKLSRWTDDPVKDKTWQCAFRVK
jgi:hypothetical protein